MWTKEESLAVESSGLKLKLAIFFRAVLHFSQTSGQPRVAAFAPMDYYFPSVSTEGWRKGENPLQLLIGQRTAV